MPLIEVKMFEQRFEDPELPGKVVKAMTDALCDVLGEGARAETWVIVSGVPSTQWGIGGETRAPKRD